MGTNYYLRKKVDLTKRKHLPSNINVLSNGFVWGETYYPTLKALNGEYYEELHIGKSSWGWVFSLQGYPFHSDYNFLEDCPEGYSLNSIEDWINEIHKPNSIGIYDEYGECISFEHFMEVFTREGWEDRPVRENNKGMGEGASQCSFKNLWVGSPIYVDKKEYKNGVIYSVTNRGEFC